MVRLEGEHIVVRSLVETDAELLAQYWTENGDHLARFQPGEVATFGRAAYWSERLPAMLVDRRHVRFATLARGDERVLGGLISLHDVVFGPLCAAMLGYSIAARYQGRGWMSEALRLVIGYAFGTLSLHKVYASFDVENVRSRTLLERAGFSYEGRLRAHLRVRGEWRDLDQMSLIHDAWQPPPPIVEP